MGASSEDTIPAVVGLAAQRVCQMVHAVTRGYFHVGAVRRPEWRSTVTLGRLRNDERMQRRRVGEDGRDTHVLLRRFASSPMRQAREPRTGHLPQEFTVEQVDVVAGDVLRRIVESRGTAFPLACVTALASGELLSRLDAWDGSGRGKDGGLARDLLNHVLHRRELSESELWHELKPLTLAWELAELRERAEAAVGGVWALPEDELLRLNRLLLDSAIWSDGDAFPSNEIRDPRTREHERQQRTMRSSKGFVLETFCSAWLDYLVNTHIRERPRSGDRREAWTSVERPSGRLITLEPPPIEDFPGDKSPDDLGTLGSPSFGISDAAPANMSSGFHQVAPFVVQTGLMQPYEVLSVENPEVHLHPSAQRRVAEFFLEQLDRDDGKRFIVETHSDLIIRRVLRAILDERIAGHSIRQAQIQIYFAALPTEGDGSSTLTPLTVDARGNPEWPAGFLTDDIEEAQGLLDALERRGDGLGGPDSAGSDWEDEGESDDDRA